jgi:hypothetical protein
LLLRELADQATAHFPTPHRHRGMWKISRPER